METLRVSREIAYCFSVGGRDRGVIPIGQQVLEPYGKRFKETFARLACDSISLVEYSVGECQPCAGPIAPKACGDDVKCSKRNAAPCTRDMRKKAVFNRVVIRAMRWIMRYANRNVNPIDQSLQVVLKNSSLKM